MYDPIGHWQAKIGSYLEAEWANRPSEFVQMFSKYLPENARVLDIGTGAGQDALWLSGQGHEVTGLDLIDDFFTSIEVKANDIGNKITLVKADLSTEWPFTSGSFEGIYSQLSLHYFSDELTQRIIDKIEDALVPGGILAIMVNSTKDSEYDPSLLDGNKLQTVGKLKKRFFEIETLRPFLVRFEEILFDDLGSTPKDEAVGTKGMIRFIGRKKI